MNPNPSPNPKRAEICSEYSSTQPPAQIWEIMVDYMKNIRELLHFSTIGTYYKTIAKSLIPQQIPWMILIPQENSPRNNYILHCLNLLDFQVYEFELPRVIKESSVASGLKSKLFGAKDGWLISRSWIYNPFTGESALLPEFELEYTTLGYIPTRLPTATLLKVADNKGLCGLCLLGQHTRKERPFLWTPNNVIHDGHSWTSTFFLETKHIVRPYTWDAMVYKGCLYELYGDARICVFDLNHGTLKYIAMKFSCSSHVLARYKGRYLVELWGELHLVLIHGSDNSVRIFKLDLDQVKWSDERKEIVRGQLEIDFENKIQDIKDYAIFLGKYCSKALLLTAFMTRFLTRNCVYGVVPSFPDAIGVFSLKDGSMKPLLPDELAKKYCTTYPSPWLMSMFREDMLATESGELYVEQLDFNYLVPTIRRLLA